MSYVDLAVFKDYLRIPGDDDTDDVQLQSALDTATSEINHLCSRTFDVAGDTATTRYFQPWWDRTVNRWMAPLDDLFTAEDLAVASWTDSDTGWMTPVVVTETDLRPLGAPDRSRPWTELILPAGTSFPRSGWTGWHSDANSDYVAVTARWGWPEVPAAVVEATCIQASRVFKRRDALFGVTSSPDGSENTRLLNTVDVDVQVALRGYVKYWAGR